MLKIAVMLFFAASLFAFHFADININNKDFEAKLGFDMGQFNETLAPDSIFFGIGYCNGDASHSDLDDVDELVEAFFLMQQPFGASDAFMLGMGIKYEFSKVGDADFSALALGFEGIYLLPFELSIPMYLGAKFYYSPEVLSFGDAKNYIEYRFYYDVEIISRGHINIGYRAIDLNFDRADIEYNHAWYLGFRFQF